MSDQSFLTTGEVQVRPLDKKKQAIWWLIAPHIALIVVLIVWGIAAMAMQASGNSEMTGAANIVNVVLGILAGVSLLGSLFGWIGAIIVGSKRVPMQMTYDKRSGPGSTEPAPEEIKGWNWGAAFLSPFWGTWYGVWWWLIAFIPGVGGIWWIIMGIFGSEWAWKADYWPSVDAFKASQRKWKPWGIFFMVLMILSIAASFVLPLVFFTALRATGALEQMETGNTYRYDPYVTSSTDDTGSDVDLEALLRDLERE